MQQFIKKKFKLKSYQNIFFLISEIISPYTYRKIPRTFILYCYGS